MTGIRAVKAFRKEKRNEKEFGDLVEDYRAANGRTIQLFGIFDPGLVLIGNLTLAAVLLVGGLRVATGGVEIGTLLAVLLYTRQFFGPAEEMAMFYNALPVGGGGAREDLGRARRGAERSRPGAAGRHCGRRRGASPSTTSSSPTASDRVVLPQFDLDIPAGQTIALVGSTGAGKSTLAKLISRFYDPTKGEVDLDGIDLRKLHPEGPAPRDRHGDPGGVPVLRAASPTTSRSGSRMRTREEIVAAAKAVGAHEFIQALPDGYDTDVNKRGGRVSAGQRQLLSFARAFIADPVVLILDEATASLDIPSERLVQEGLQTLLAGPHRRDHRAPVVDGRDRRPGARDGARRDRRGWRAERAHRRHRPLRAAARRVARLAGVGAGRRADGSFVR